MAHGDYNCCALCDCKMDYNGWGATTKKEIDYNNFYKEDLVRMVAFLNKEYNKLKEQVEEIRKWN